MRALTIFAAMLMAVAHGQDSVLADSAKQELVAASDLAAPKSLSELTKEKSDSIKAFTTAKPGAGFTVEQRSYLAGLYLLTDAKTIARLNAASPRNFRLPAGLVTLAGEVLLPFDLITDPTNYKWCHEELRAMKIVARSPKDFPAPKPIVPPK